MDALPQPHGRWSIAVFDDPTPNAFALPGGKIGVHTGMLRVARTPDQLAAVIAHEIAHVLADHSNERLTRELAVQGGLMLVDLFADEPSAGRWALGRSAGCCCPTAALTSARPTASAEIRWRRPALIRAPASRSGVAEMTMVLATLEDQLAGLVFEAARKGEREVFEGRYHRRRADPGAQTVRAT